MWPLLLVDAALLAGVWTIGATVEDVLLERGILGVLVLVLGTFAYKTIQEQRRQLIESQERERALTSKIYTETIPIIERLSATADSHAVLDTKAADLIRDCLEVLTDVRRQLEQRGPPR